MKLCECGCGQPTKIITKNHTRSGVRIGEYRRFAAVGHNKRLMQPHGYPEQGTGIKKERIHRLRAERALGHALPPKVEVHHADGSKSAEAPLVICQNHAYHMLLHVRARTRADGWNPNTHHRCRGCHTYWPIADFSRLSRRSTGLNSLCVRCLSTYNKASYTRKKQRLAYG